MTFVVTVMLGLGIVLIFSALENVSIELTVISILKNVPLSTLQGTSGTQSTRPPAQRSGESNG